MHEVVPSARIEVVNPGVRVGANAPTRTYPSHRIISVGALKERKGYHIALEAFAETKELIPDLKYVIVGDQRDKTYYERLKELAVRLNVQDAVTFKQHLSEQQLADEYRSAGLFMLPSVNVGDHFEGFGLVFLEAAGMGLPVVGTTGNGISDAVGPENGILVPQNDPHSTADAIIRILSDVKLYEKMSSQSSRWASLHDEASMIGAYEHSYETASK